MADAPVKMLLQNLNTLLIQEASLQRGARGDFEEIKNQLDSMKSFLRDADMRNDGHEGRRTWVRQIRDATHNVEDIVDDFTYRMDRPRRSGCTHCILEIIRLPEMIFHRHQLATRIQELKSQIATILLRKDQFQVSRIEVGSASNSSNATERLQHRDGSALFMDSDEVVGLEEQIKELVEWLRRDDLGRNVIAIVGMGGLGKTTLAAEAYKKAKAHFDCSVWVSGSQSCRVEKLLKEAIKDLFQASKNKLPSNLNSMNCRQLLGVVNEYLASKRYIVVIDDIWSLDVWTALHFAFPRNEHGSRIVVTTRQEDVALCLGDASPPYYLKPLQQKAAWDLFCQFASWKEFYTKELEALARRILSKCEGLPLAIIALGSLLSLRRETVPEWDRVYKDLQRQFSQNRNLQQTKHILLLSFYDLPYNLKQCFLYCCVFPEDYLIHRRQLIRLWVAEGFVEDGGRITMEEAAEECLRQLVHRNLLQVIYRNESGRFKSFKVHDIFREVALSVSNKENFCMIYDGRPTSQSGRSEEFFRRISIHSTGESAQMPMTMKRVRSVLVFDKSVSFSSSLKKMVSSYRFIRVLNLQGVPIQCLPGELTNLFNLRYLNLRDTEVSKLPKSFGKLRNLQTLDLTNTKVERLPTGIGQLKKLRHLFCHRLNDSKYESFNHRTSIKAPPELYNIRSLLSLAVVEVEGEIATLIGKLTQLRTLSIAKVRAADVVKLCASIRKMECLVFLAIRAFNEEEALDLEALSLNPPPLQKLVLQGYLKKVPQWLGSLSSLTHLWLFWSQLKEEDQGCGLLSTLRELRHLVLLYLHKAYFGRQLLFQDKWFPKLKTLYFVDFMQLNRLVIEKGAMPPLEELWLVSCGELKMLPQGIEHLRNLQKLILEEMPSEFVERLRSTDGNEERQKVAHIPLIQHWKMENRNWQLDRLS